MLPAHDQYVVRVPKGWAVVEDGKTEPFGIYTSKHEATRKAEQRALRHHSYLVVYDGDGTIWMRNC